MRYIVCFLLLLLTSLTSIYATTVTNVQNLTLPASSELQNCSNGFAASITSYNNQYISSYMFSCPTDNDTQIFNNLAIATLNSNLQTTHITNISHQVRGVDYPLRDWNSHLFVYQNKLYMLFDMVTNLRSVDYANSPYRQSYIAEIAQDNANNFYVREYKRLFSPYPENPKEMNWKPLIYNGTLYFVYSLSPELIILKPNLATGEAIEVSRSSNKFSSTLTNGTNYIQISNNKYVGLAQTEDAILPIMIEYSDDKFHITNLGEAIDTTRISVQGQTASLSSLLYTEQKYKLMFGIVGFEQTFITTIDELATFIRKNNK